MARQWMIPGGGVIDEDGTEEYFVPGLGVVAEDQAAAAAAETNAPLVQLGSARITPRYRMVGI